MTDRLAIGRQIYDYFVARGLQPHQAAAIAGNMAWEGGGRTDLVNPGDNWKNSPASPHSVGLGQWNDRAPALIEFARSRGLDIPQGDMRDARYMQDVIRRIPMETQLEFSWSELQGPERRAYQRISQGGDLRSATGGAISYHRPAGWSWGNPEAGHGFSNRLSLAQSILVGAGSQPGTYKATFEAEPEVPTLQQPSASPAVASANPGQSASPSLMETIAGTVFGRNQTAESKPMEYPRAPEMPAATDPRRQVDLSRLLTVISNRPKLGV